ncbi:MAG: hypothetical protein AAGA48_34825 [Myxococcota bacterium]
MRWFAWMLAGCSAGGALTGEVDATTPMFEDAAFIQEADYFGPGQDLIFVRLGPAGLCEASAAVATSRIDFYATEDLDQATNYAEAWQAAFPSDVWLAELLLRVDDLETSLRGETLPGALNLGNPPEGSLVQAQFLHFFDHFDAVDLTTGQPSDYLEAFASDGGTLSVQGHSPGQSIRGQLDDFVIRFDEAEPLRLAFRARHCEAWETQFVAN